MRTLIDIPEEQIARLSALARAEQVSRAALVRRAIAGFLQAQKRCDQDTMQAAFGLWGPGDDGLEYQERMRREW